MTNNHIVSLVNMRLKLCSESDNHQQIVAIGTLRDKNLKTNEMPSDKKIRYLYAYGAEETAINTIKDRMEIQKYKTEEIKEYDSQQILEENTTKSCSILGWSGHVSNPKFTQNCAMQSFCHIAAKAMSNYNKHKQLRKIDLVNLNSQREKKYSINKTYFGISACIKNEPGTIYALISMLTGTYPCVMKFVARSFDFNVEHLRSCLCRVTKCVKIDLYGRFNRKKEQENAQQQNMTHLKRLSNVQSIAFYDLDTNDSTNDSIKNLLKPYTCNDSNCSDECEHIFKILTTDGLKKEKTETPFETLLYINKNAKVKSEAKFIAHECPIARLLVHQNDSSQASKTSCIFREKVTTDKKKEEKKYGKTIKIEACLRNVPGALKELADVIAIQR